MMIEFCIEFYYVLVCNMSEYFLFVNESNGQIRAFVQFFFTILYYSCIVVVVVCST